MTARLVQAFGEGLGGGPAKTWWCGLAVTREFAAPQVSGILGFRRPAAEPLAFVRGSRGPD